MLLLMMIFPLFWQHLPVASCEIDAFGGDQVLVVAEVFRQHWTKVALGLVVYLILLVSFRPMNRIKKLNDVGWSHLLTRGTGSRPKSQLIREVQRMRKLGDLPPVYPNGWFAVEESRNVAAGKVKSAHFMGEPLVIFRDEDGAVHVLEAYCPHLGANMAVGGKVRGGCIECPFHGWQFDGKSGLCVHIPYAKKVPEFARVKKWTSAEAAGFVFVWFDAEDRSPTWEVPTVEEVQSGLYAFRGRTQHDIFAHIQEIPENGSDMAHLGHLHVPNIMKGANLLEAFSEHKFLDVARHLWEGKWRALGHPNEHMAEVAIKHSVSLFSRRMKLLEMDVSIQQVGPGLVILRFVTFLGKGIFIQTVTPQEPLRQRVIHQFYSASSLVAPFAKIIILGEAFHVERDIMIWNSKKYLSKPLLLAEDKMVLKFRRWYSQFYSKNSPKLEHFRKDDFNW